MLDVLKLKVILAVAKVIVNKSVYVKLNPTTNVISILMPKSYIFK